MNTEITSLISDFLIAASLAGVTINQEDLRAEFLKAPHTPPKHLPKGQMAVYVFLYNGLCLKVGKVNSKTQARYTHHHYGIKRASSSLALSIFNHSSDFGILSPDDESVRKWILTNTTRVNLLLPEQKGGLVLNLLEAFIQCRFNPRFEGREK